MINLNAEEYSIGTIIGLIVIIAIIAIVVVIIMIKKEKESMNNEIEQDYRQMKINKAEEYWADKVLEEKEKNKKQSK